MCDVVGKELNTGFQHFFPFPIMFSNINVVGVKNLDCEGKSSLFPRQQNFMPVQIQSTCR